MTQTLNANSYRSSLLKKWVKSNCQGAVCICVPGQSGIVSSAITISEALGKVAKLEILQEDNEDIEVAQKSDDQVIHEVIGIFHRRINNIKERMKHSNNLRKDQIT